MGCHILPDEVADVFFGRHSLCSCNYIDLVKQVTVQFDFNFDKFLILIQWDNIPVLI